VRPKDDAIARWAVTVSAKDSAIEVASSHDLGDPPLPSEIDLDQLIPALTAEALAHTWDLAKAMGVDPRLDTGLPLKVAPASSAALRNGLVYFDAASASKDYAAAAHEDGAMVKTCYQLWPWKR
jgi:hypothetical protein